MAANLFLNTQYRLTLYTVWHAQRIREQRMQADTPYTPEERCIFLADWLRWCIKEGHLDPHRKLPAYEDLAPLPFDLGEQDVAQVIEVLRTTHDLPPRKKRKDADRPQWTPRDLFCLSYIGHMHTLRFDQLQRLLARTSPSEEATAALAFSRTWEIVARWVQAGFADFVRDQLSGAYLVPRWVYLTHKGLTFVDLPFRAQEPSPRSLEHLYWITEVRMHLELDYPAMQWISERSLQAGRGMREAGQKREHLTDGILILPSRLGEVRIDIEVQISKTGAKDVREVMAGADFWTDNVPLWYFVNKQSQGIVRMAYHKMSNDLSPMRPSIEIIDLEHYCSTASP